MCIFFDINQTKLLLLKFKELLFLVRPESKLLVRAWQNVHGSTCKFHWATCSAWPCFEQWDLQSHLITSTIFCFCIKKFTGKRAGMMAFCRDSPTETESELALWAWRLWHSNLKRKNCPLSSLWFPEGALHWGVWSCWRQFSLFGKRGHNFHNFCWAALERTSSCSQEWLRLFVFYVLEWK